MNRTLAALLVTLAVITGCSTGPDTGSPAAASPSVASAPTPALTPEPTTPSMNPTPEPTASLVAHTLRPCCLDEDSRAASMTFAIMAPPSWEAWEGLGVWPVGQGNDPPDGAYVGLYLGGNVFSEPCLTNEDASADLPVGPTVHDLVTALVDHPSLDVTAPVDATLAGYSGTYLDLTVPDDISKCVRYMPVDHHIYAQGPSQRWHMWILDVDGVRVLVETNDYAGTPADRLAQEQTIVDSLEITP